MKRDKKGIGRNRIFSVKSSVCIFVTALCLTGCGVFGGGKAEVKVDFGQYGDTGSGSPAAGSDDGTERTENSGLQTGGETADAPGQPEANESTDQAESNGGQSGTTGSPGGWPGKDDDAAGDQTETQSGTESTAGSAGETAAGSGTETKIEVPKEHRDEFNKSEFAEELLTYLEANGRGAEAFSEPIFDSEKKIYSKEELEKLSDVMCKIFRNEIYARHGMIFGDEDLNQLYGAFSWYKGTIGLREFEAQAELPFNETEHANISNVVAVEKARREQNGN